MLQSAAFMPLIDDFHFPNIFVMCPVSASYCLSWKILPKFSANCIFTQRVLTIAILSVRPSVWIFFRFWAARHISRANCTKINWNKHGNAEYEIFSIERRFRRSECRLSRFTKTCAQ